MIIIITLKNLTQRKKLSTNLLFGQCLQDVHVIKKKINLIITEEKIKLCKKLKECAMKIINPEEKEMIPLTKEENKSYKKQEKCHICEEKFCMDKDNENYTIEKRLKIIVITQKNLEGLLIVNAI